MPVDPEIAQKIRDPKTVTPVTWICNKIWAFHQGMEALIKQVDQMCKLAPLSFLTFVSREKSGHLFWRKGMPHEPEDPLPSMEDL